MSLLLCLTRDALPKSMLLIAKIPVYSYELLSLFFIHSNSILLILLHQFFLIILFDIQFFFPLQWLPSDWPHALLAFGTNKAGIMLAAAISPTVVHFGRVTCSALCCLRQTSILSFSDFNTQYDLAIAMCSEYSVTDSTTTFKHFECVGKVHNTFCYSSPKWWNHDFPHSENFTFQPLEIVLWNVKAFYSISIETMVSRCTSFQVSPASHNSFLVIVATNWSMTWVPICIRTLSP